MTCPEVLPAALTATAGAANSPVALAALATGAFLLTFIAGVWFAAWRIAG